MKKIAIPITKDNKIENHFGRCKFYEIYSFSDKNEIIDLQLLESDGKCGCKSNIINTLTNEGVTFMLSGNIGDSAMHKLNNAGIGVIRGCKGNSADVILEFVEGKITDNGISCVKHHHNHTKGHAHACNH
ncbi:Predicted Fe-Mo cluster-binding protein, NifX family [Polaribacter sp. KT25b]|uniref:NifB/NifX family molybdenum-iron cluster-binding protein n=1 Tax=Polaribacter sp. KT25b TaxID=1855336 RepID=UPI00087976D8|nr:NifB/NifX family molybdenum-iron cluster-binding protein [Polaribacter sp. KT25b]SDS02078.1 Predicted Fe-Mo cluster-binding protein, NifX family [Polaribacter sp. KT25b]